MPASLASNAHKGLIIAGEQKSYHFLLQQPWPSYDPGIVTDRSVEIPIQINGKLRDRVCVSVDSTEEAVIQQALALPGVHKLTKQKQIVKTIFVPNKMSNIVVS